MLHSLTEDAALQNPYTEDLTSSTALPYSDVDVDGSLPQHHAVYIGSSVCYVWKPALCCTGKLFT